MKNPKICAECKKALRIALSAIIVLIFMNLVLITKLDTFKKVWKRFTYEDWVALYKICSKNWGKKETLIYRSYWQKETDFKKFLLGK